MRKLFSVKIDLDPSVLFERISTYKTTKSDHGIYDVAMTKQLLTGAFWLREEIIVLNELNIYESAEPVTFFKVNRCVFSLQSITKKELILSIDSSSKSIKPFLKWLEGAIQTTVFISQIKISLFDLSKHIEKSDNALVKITHSYSSNQTISKHEKISFSVYSNENAIIAAQRIISDVSLEFERVKIESYQDGVPVVLDIKSNCLYSVSTPNSKLEKTLIDFVIKTEAAE
ncbi:hypothetical protein HX836_20795 [Pseudomonas yamanorum]|uniref:hypothetical protein n=1 Tax=Pseudomonas yamanorum TaxID=515393 RepID=UPI0015A08582|nr:hypothetical protein [Pseudomonas yamanorum]NVZ84257.1 hypothetical protein [Pseudomonas yamanorum]